MDPVVLAAFGLPGLFLAAFLAGSVVPLPSEAVLVALVGGGLPAFALVAVATAGNVLGAATLYWLGRSLAGGGVGPLGRALARRTERNPAAFDRARERLRRWGPAALLCSWMPVVGDGFVLAAGYAGVRPLAFLLFTTAGKAARFAVVAASASAAFSAFA